MRRPAIGTGMWTDRSRRCRARLLARAGRIAPASRTGRQRDSLYFTERQRGSESMADDLEHTRKQLPALRSARDNDGAILSTRRAELMQLRAALGDIAGTTGPLYEREIYLVASIKRLEEQLAALNPIGRAHVRT